MGINANRTIAFDLKMHVSDSSSLIDSIYPNIDKIIPTPLYFLNHIILSLRNADANELNCHAQTMCGIKVLDLWRQQYNLEVESLLLLWKLHKYISAKLS